MPAREVAVGKIALAGGAIALMVALVVATVLGWLHLRGTPPGGERLGRPYSLTVPGAPLQSAPQPDLRAYRAQKQRQLHGLGWVDAPHGLVHIPIEQAMALMAARSASAPEARP